MGQKQASKRSIRRAACGVVLAAVLVSACGGSSTGPAPVTLEQLPGRVADAVCDNIGGCCQAVAAAFDLATCKANLTAALTKSLATETTSNIVYDSAAAGNCVSVYGSQVKSCSVDESTLNAACQPVFVGKLAPGAACTVSNECHAPPGDQAYCDAGTCTLLSGPDTGLHGKLGDACGGSCQTNETCGGTAPSGETGTPAPTALCYYADKLYCAASQTCQPLVPIGSACSFEGCVTGAFCKAGTCAAGLPNGASCTDDTECAAGSCVFASSVESATGTCGALVIANAQTCAGNFQ